MEQHKPLETKELANPERIRASSVSERAKVAVAYLVENRCSKKEALLAAGYPESTATNPSRVFGTPGVQALLKECGIHPETVINRIYRQMYARSPVHMVFPKYNPEKARELEQSDELTLEDNSEKAFFSQMKDSDIREFIEGNGGTVFKITHGEQARHVYYWADNSKAQLTAAGMFKDMLGLDAPKKVDMKGEVNHKFSLSGLRSRIEANGVEVITPKDG